jgi:PAS domain S-box-containing protein
MVNNILYWSDEQFNLLGYKKGEIEPTNELFFSMVHPEDSERVTKNFNTTFVTLENSYSNFRMVRRDGKTMYCYCEWRFEFDINRKPIRIFGIVQDITERTLGEIERTKMISDIIKRNQDLEQFSYIVSHNLRAPVANLLGLTDIIGSISLGEKEKEIAIQGLSISTHKLDEVIRDLNHILQVRRDVGTRMERVFFSDVLYDVKSGISESLKKENVEFDLNFSEANEMPAIKSYLYSIFYNLISNSIKFKQPAINPVIEINSRKCETGLVITYKDNGVGIDLVKYHKQVFGLYNRFHDKLEGKGMGLYMVKTQVEALGGKINIKSEVNKGTEFEIEFVNSGVAK